MSINKRGTLGNGFGKAGGPIGRVDDCRAFRPTARGRSGGRWGFEGSPCLSRGRNAPAVGKAKPVVPSQPEEKRTPLSKREILFNLLYMGEILTYVFAVFGGICILSVIMELFVAL